jgi:hypothetical protein
VDIRHCVLSLSLTATRENWRIWYAFVLYIYRWVQKIYSFFDSQYLWNKVTCSYNSCTEREWVIICIRSDNHQRLYSVDAAELLSELWLSVCLVWWLHMTFRWFLVACAVWLAFVDKLHPSRFPIGRSREVLGLETVVGIQ